MSIIAYSDFERTQKITAREAVESNHDIRYYCFNKRCNARLHVVHAESYYFAADKSSPHTDYCPFAAKALFDPGQYNEASFEFDKLIAHLLNPSAKNESGSKILTRFIDHPHSKNLSIRTLGVLYDMCEQLEIDGSYNSVPIRSIVFDSRCDADSLQLHDEFRVIECQSERPDYLRYDRQHLTITLYAPVNSRNRKQFVLKFKEHDLYRKIQNTLYENKNKLIVVAGIWRQDSTGNSFATMIDIGNQLRVIR